MIVTLVRHGTAEDSAHRDRERELTAAGRLEVRALGDSLRRAVALPDRMLCSPFVRAVQTAEILAAALGYSGAIGIERGLRPECDPGGIVDLLAASATGPSPSTDPTVLTRSGRRGPVAGIALVAHEPILSAIWELLLGQRVPGLRRAEAVSLSWDPVTPGSARLIWRGCPSDTTA